MTKIRAHTVDAYIAAAPAEAQPLLRELRDLLRQAAPTAEEAIKWGMPAFEDQRLLFTFAAYRTHLNFAPTHSAMVPFLGELASHTLGHDTIQFPYSQPLPAPLIRKIAAFRVREVLEHDQHWISSARPRRSPKSA